MVYFKTNSLWTGVTFKIFNNLRSSDKFVNIIMSGVNKLRIHQEYHMVLTVLIVKFLQVIAIRLMYSILIVIWLQTGVTFSMSERNSTKPSYIIRNDWMHIDINQASSALSHCHQQFQDFDLQTGREVWHCHFLVETGKLCVV